ncbi:MAG: sigma-70 family RNA polymerase sigma factor [Methylobacter sp.]|nr:sigma-70 family RNA polymerase sigma factor [Methylobacter sp.]
MSESKLDFLHEIFLKHAHEVSTFICVRWPREQDVADIVQELFLWPFQYPHPETIHNPRAFLFQTASNMAVDRHRRLKIRERYTEPDPDLETLADTCSSPASYWETHEDLERYIQWLDELPELHRHAFILFRIEGYSHAEIALHLSISVSSSERYVKSAMQLIAKRLGAERP